jgi:hypothetical protein
MLHLLPADSDEDSTDCASAEVKALRSHPARVPPSRPTAAICQQTVIHSTDWVPALERSAAGLLRVPPRT